MVNYYGLLAFASLAAAAPATLEVRQDCKPHTICVDKINPCGVRYGGCYDACKTADAPIAPLCASTSTPVISWTTATVPATTSTQPSVPSTTARTICVDYINKCGQTYGGCFASTSPWPTFTGPSCSLETTAHPITTAATSTPVATTAVPTICVDSINSCGKTYGGCFASTSPFPTFSDPGCP